jgi:hypothetical protein
MKYFIAILVTAVLVFLGATVYYKGLPTFPSYSKNPVSTESATLATVEAVPTPTPVSTLTIKGGGILEFNSYTVEVPSTWKYTKEGAPSGDIELEKLILTKGDYKITIYQAATGGAICLYPGDPDTEGPSSKFTTFTELKTATNDKLRISGTGSGNLTVCQMTGTNPWGEPTSFGHISIALPAVTTPEMITEINGIIASLKKI